MNPYLAAIAAFTLITLVAVAASDAARTPTRLSVSDCLTDLITSGQDVPWARVIACAEDAE